MADLTPERLESWAQKIEAISTEQVACADEEACLFGADALRAFAARLRRDAEPLPGLPSAEVADQRDTLALMVRAVTALCEILREMDDDGQRGLAIEWWPESADWIIVRPEAMKCNPMDAVAFGDTPLAALLALGDKEPADV